MDKFRVLCFVALYLQSTSAQCIRNPMIEVPMSAAAILPLSSSTNLAESLAAVQSSSSLSQWAFSMLSPISPLTMSCLGGFGPSALAASNGGGLFTTSFSPFAPSGIMINSVNYFDGTVSIAGQVPFLGSIALEGELPSAGMGSIVYGCGNGDIYILSEDITDPYCDYGYDIGYGCDRPLFGYGVNSRYY